MARKVSTPGQPTQYTGIGVALGAGVGMTIGVLVGGWAIAIGMAVGAGVGSPSGRPWTPDTPTRLGSQSRRRPGLRALRD
jgi:hypothetical protein